MAIGVTVDGSGQRDDCYDLGDAMDILQGLRFHMRGRQWQMLDNMVAAKLRADGALGTGWCCACPACSSSQNWPRSWQASKRSRAAEKRKSVPQTGCVQAPQVGPSSDG